VFATVEKIAAAEKINASYVGRVLRLTLLAPEIVDGRQPAEMALAVLMRRFAVGWDRQRAMGFGSGGYLSFGSGLAFGCPSREALRFRDSSSRRWSFSRFLSCWTRDRCARSWP